MKSSFVRSTGVCLLAGLPVVLLAADKPPAGEQPWRPAALAPEASLTLLDAVRLTLQNDPNIRLTEAQFQQKLGVTKELSGQFDMTLRANGGYSYNREELRDSTKRREQKNRDDLDAIIPVADSVLAGLNQALTNLQNPNAVEDPSSIDFTQGVENERIANDLLKIQGNLILLTGLIERTADPVLRLQLEGLRDETLQAGIDAFEAQVTELENVPQDLRDTRAALGDAPEEQFTRRWNGHVDLAKQFRSGIVVDPYAELTFSGSNYVGKSSTDGAQGGQGVPDLYRGEIGFDVRLPLRRGLGATSVAAGENASKKDAEATRLTMLHQESQSILQTILAYWDARSAADQVEVGRRSVKLQADLLNLTQELIKAGEMPAADEARNQASYADALARLDAAERRLHESRINLARAIGMSLPAASAGPMPADAFPPPVQVAAPDEAVLALVRTAFDRRNDLLAAQTILEAAGILVKGAKDDTRRLLNVDGSFWGTGLGEDEISNVDRWVFKSGEARATFEMPFKNNQAMGRYGQRQASERQAAIDAGDQARTIGLNVERLSRSLALAAERLQRARESVVAYDKTIESEQAKLKAGDSTLIDTILTEQQTTAARLTLVSAEQEYATTLARLLFETGLILDRQEGIAKVNGDALVGVPAQLQGARQ
jgi:outer membrane protein TolC